MTTRNYNIVVTVDPNQGTRGANAVRQSLVGVERQANSMQAALRRAFAFVGVAAAVREVAKLGEAYQQAQNRLRTVTGSTEELAAVQDALFRVAQRTRAEFNSTVETYARVRGATQQLGLSQQQTIDFIERVNKAVQLSGAGVQEAQGAMRQFTQALGSGTLRGEELNSVLEQTPVIADVIAKQLGVTRGQLKRLAQEGKLTTDEIIKAFENADDILSRFDRTTATVSQSWVRLTNAVQRYAGETDNALGVSSALSGALGFLASNVDTIARVLLAVGLATAVAFAPFLAGTLAAAVAAVLNPITLVIAAFSAVVAFSDRIVVLRDGFTSLRDVVRELFDEVGSLVPGWLTAVVSAFSQLFSYLKRATDEIGGFKALWEAALRLMAMAMDASINLTGRFFNGLVAALRALPGVFGSTFEAALEAAMRALKDGLNAATDAINHFISKYGGSVTRAMGFKIPRPFEDQVGTLYNADEGTLTRRFAEGFARGVDSTTVSDALGRAMDRASAQAHERARQADNDAAVGGFDLTKRGDRTLTQDPTRQQVKRLDLMGQVNRELRREYELLGLNREQQEIRNQLFAIEEKFQRNKTPLTNAETEAIRRQLEQLQQLRRVMGVVEDAATAVFGGMESALVQFVQTGKLAFKELADSIVADLVRIALRAFVTNQLISAVTGWAGSMVAPAQPRLPPYSHAQARFASGGSFVVPGAGGTDSRMVAFRATPGERVTVSRPDQGGGGGPGRGPSQVVNVINNARGTEVQQRERTAGGTSYVDVIISTVKEGLGRGEFDAEMAGGYGVRRGVKRR